jgi:hypothetical protein
MAAALCYGVGGGAQLCFHRGGRQLRHRQPDRVFQGLRKFLGGEKATPLWDGCRPAVARPCSTGFALSDPGWWWGGCPPTRPT